MTLCGKCFFKLSDYSNILVNERMYVVGIAAQEGHEHCVRALLNHGADPNHSDHCGRNAIKVAAKSGHDTVVRLLEEHSANQRSLRPGINGGYILFN